MITSRADPALAFLQCPHRCRHSCCFCFVALALSFQSRQLSGENLCPVFQRWQQAWPDVGLEHTIC
jgi:hypothetical protein